MTRQTFALQPFGHSQPPLPYTVTGAITRQGRQFAVHYVLCGRLADLVIPAPTADVARMNVGLSQVRGLLA